MRTIRRFEVTNVPATIFVTASLLLKLAVFMLSFHLFISLRGQDSKTTETAEGVFTLFSVVKTVDIGFYLTVVGIASILSIIFMNIGWRLSDERDSVFGFFASLARILLNIGSIFGVLMFIIPALALNLFNSSEVQVGRDNGFTIIHVPSQFSSQIGSDGQYEDSVLVQVSPSSKKAKSSVPEGVYEMVISTSDEYEAKPWVVDSPLNYLRDKIVERSDSDVVTLTRVADELPEIDSDFKKSHGVFEYTDSYKEALEGKSSTKSNRE